MKRPTRRRVLRAFGAFIVTGATAGTWARFVEPHGVEFVERELRVPNLPAMFVGKRILQLSDFHIGSTNLEYLHHIVERANAHEPDMLALTGDFIHHNAANSINEVTRLLQQLNRPPFGAFACLGNHDYGSGWRQVAVGDAVARAVLSAGVLLLRNRMLTLDGLQIIGLDDLWSPRYGAHATLHGVDPSRASICLSHNPDMCDQPVWGNFRGVILSGHTHGGQCKPPFLPPPFLPVMNRRYVAGEYAIDERRTLFVNRGVGHTLPVRFNCRPEVTVFTLNRC